MGFGSTTLDLLYPPACAACGAETAARTGLCAPCFRESGFISGPICARCGAPGLDLCDACAHAPPAWDRGRAVALYEGAARRIVLALKHGDRIDVARTVAPWLLRAGGTLVAEADLVAPVPLHWTRLLTRRFNQSAELARALTRAADRPETLAADLLTRIRRTPSQDGRTRAGRLANVAGAFMVSKRWRGRVAGRRVLLIDDVMTTGATLSACAEALRGAGAAGVDVITLSRVARDAGMSIS
jgi:ComF family protein